MGRRRYGRNAVGAETDIPKMGFEEVSAHAKFKKSKKKANNKDSDDLKEYRRMVREDEVLQKKTLGKIWVYNHMFGGN